MALIAAPGARADYEQLPLHFATGGEPERVQGATAAAINPSGAGGVEPGSLYVAGTNGRVLRFSPGTEGAAPQFREAWGWNVGSTAGEYQRCGPAYASELRPPHTFATCRPVGTVEPGEQVGEFGALGGVAVDQATGDVYVLNVPLIGKRVNNLIEVFTANGVPVGEGFGDLAPQESIAESPDKLHGQFFATEDGLAVNEAGTVFVIDHEFVSASPPSDPRIMSFQPEAPGNFEHYVYSGQAHDITTSSEGTRFRRVAVVGSDRVVAASSKLVREYATGGGSTPLCSFKVAGGQAIAMTANPTSGEVFVFVEGAQSKLRRLGSCNQATGQFAELQGPIVPSPETEGLFALAVNPSLQWSPSRQAGILYGADSENVSSPHGIGDIFVPAVAAPPVVESESVANATSSSATLQARIDPLGVSVAFHFQYLRASEYLANGESFEGPNPPRLAPLSAGHLAGGKVGLASAAVSGLEPAVAYAFRVVAERDGCLGEASCRTNGPVAIFSTYPQASAGPPDGRAYELVSPPDKAGGEAFPADWFISSCLIECKPPGAAGFSVFPMQAAADGETVAYMGFPFSRDEGAATFNSYISRRSPTGWSTTIMSPRLLEKKSNLAYAENLTEGMIGTIGNGTLAADAPVGYENLYLQNANTPSVLQPVLTKSLFESLAPSGRPYREPGTLRVHYAGHSADFSAQYFEANDSFTSPAAFAPQPSDPGVSGRDLYEWTEGRQLALVNVMPDNMSVATGASFASAAPEANGFANGGHRVFWTAGGHVYMREDNRTTREIHHPGSFLAASPDGLEVLLSDGCLYAMTSAACVADLTQGQGGFLGLAGASQEFTRIYFVSTADLPGRNGAGEEAEPGEPNLYLYEAGGPTRFVATLNAADGQGGSLPLDDWSSAPGLRTAEASPDGRYLVFGSTAPLTGYPNVGPCGIAPTEQGNIRVAAPCKEVFLYDSVTGGLTCPSCNPTGEVPLGNSTLRRIQGAETRAWLPQPRYLTNQGRLFFDSSDRLSPLDANGLVEDVYEAEPDGLGSCISPAGCIGLISRGTSSVDSNFLAMDETGGNVFFTSRDQLVPADTDGLLDVYDARIGGGFGQESEGAGSECQGEACQPPSGAPVAPTSSTSNFQGEGNPIRPSRSCPRGKRRRHGKCVNKITKKSKHKKRSRSAGKKSGGGK